MLASDIKNYLTSEFREGLRPITRRMVSFLVLISTDPFFTSKHAQNRISKMRKASIQDPELFETLLVNLFTLVSAQAQLIRNPINTETVLSMFLEPHSSELTSFSKVKARLEMNTGYLFHPHIPFFVHDLKDYLDFPSRQCLSGAETVDNAVEALAHLEPEEFASTLYQLTKDYWGPYQDFRLAREEELRVFKMNKLEVDLMHLFKITLPRLRDLVCGAKFSYQDSTQVENFLDKELEILAERNSIFPKALESDVKYMLDTLCITLKENPRFNGDLNESPNYFWQKVEHNFAYLEYLVRKQLRYWGFQPWEIQIWLQASRNRAADESGPTLRDSFLEILDSNPIISSGAHIRVFSVVDQAAIVKLSRSIDSSARSVATTFTSDLWPNDAQQSTNAVKICALQAQIRLFLTCEPDRVFNVPFAFDASLVAFFLEPMRHRWISGKEAFKALCMMRLGASEDELVHAISRQVEGNTSLDFKVFDGLTVWARSMRKDENTRNVVNEMFEVSAGTNLSALEGFFSLNGHRLMHANLWRLNPREQSEVIYEMAINDPLSAIYLCRNLMAIDLDSSNNGFVMSERMARTRLDRAAYITNLRALEEVLANSRLASMSTTEFLNYCCKEWHVLGLDEDKVASSDWILLNAFFQKTLIEELIDRVESRIT